MTTWFWGDDLFLVLQHYNRTTGGTIRTTSRRRFLYDQAYLDANCDSSVVPLNTDNGVDSSVATLSTNYVIAGIALFFAVLLYRPGDDKERTGQFVALYLASNGLAFGLGGIGHQFSEEKEEILNRILLPIISFFGNVGTYSLLFVVLVSHVKMQGMVRTIWAVLATSLTVYASVVALDNPIATGIPGFLVLLLAFLTLARQLWRVRKTAIALKVSGFVSMIAGGIVQLSLSSVCGFDGYPECFRRCPLPAPEFNHNALFHVLAIVFYILYGVGEWRLPAQECIWILRKPVVTGGHGVSNSLHDEEEGTNRRSMSQGNLPSSPAARAFFAALDTAGKSENASSLSLVQRRIRTLGWRNRHSQDEFYPVTVDGVMFSVRQVQRGEVENTYGTGATVWPAAMVLLKYLERNATSLVKEKRIVDLGAGTGVTSFAAALLGAKEVVCTDGEEAVVQLCKENLAHCVGEISQASGQAELLNEASACIQSCSIHVQQYWWGAGTLQGGNQADIVLVADCVLPKLYPIAPLVEAIDQLLHSPHSMAILSYEYRYYPKFDPGEEFRSLCGAKGLTVQNIPVTEQDPTYSVEDIEIWRVKRSYQKMIG